MLRLRKLLWPFSLIYGAVTALRNRLYDSGRWESRSYNLPVICVGNLSVGGTGKSPMIEYLISVLKDQHRVAVLSRGYKRESKGYVEAFVDSTAEQVGDEPLQIKQKYPEVVVAVCADRREGIEQLQSQADVILLDDAFQHRKVKASLNILLTAYDDPFHKDLILPAGNLRESRSGAKRADVIIVTKCPEQLAYAALQRFEYELPLVDNQRLYFSRIGYDQSIYGATETQLLTYLKDKYFTLVTGIAKPKPLVDFLKEAGYQFEHLSYPDHHNFSSSEIALLKKKEIILTTEKDFVRLHGKLQKFALYYLPIKTQFLKEQEPFVRELVQSHVWNFR